ncbi:MAG: GNAT family N-acetyltransferase [Synergistes jonesii]|uniref:GNAT family N-acetyltransferase n=1 Tax=Synergistes jonesii TaxID=2754 RepID=UPI002A749D62|nr:GNAT family N-acetyltransferase [Synergistes jonesii]MDY2984680.1 GNAT family N-acetyltransferase [Synergistes jonesii]
MKKIRLSDLKELQMMFTISYSTPTDVDDVLKIDTYIPRRELIKKISTRPEEIYLLREDDKVVGVLRYGIFWDYIPYMCFLSVSEKCRDKGYAQKALIFWEEKMKEAGWPVVMTSIPTDDAAQHFYRRMGYTDTGCLCLHEPPFAQPMEIFFIKNLKNEVER